MIVIMLDNHLNIQRVHFYKYTNDGDGDDDDKDKDYALVNGWTLRSRREALWKF